MPGGVHAFIPSTLGAEAGGFPEVKATMVYKASFRAARATKRKHLEKSKKKKGRRGRSRGRMRMKKK